MTDDREARIAQARADLRAAADAGVDFEALSAWVDGTTPAERIEAAGSYAERERLWRRIAAQRPDLVLCWKVSRGDCRGPVQQRPWESFTVPSCIEHGPEDDWT